MHEAAILHFDFSNLSADQQFTLHAGSRRYDLAPHTRHTLARSRRDNAALALLPDHRITHFGGPVRLPANCPVLLRVTAPKLRPDELIDRLVLTSVHLPRRHRIAGLARRQRRQPGRPLSLPAKLAAYGVTGDLPPDKVLIDIGDFNAAYDAAYSLVFHHAELLSLQPAPATDIITLIEGVDGIDLLAQSIDQESQAHEADPSQPNWVSSKSGIDWKTGQPSNPIYVWSDNTKENLARPLHNALQASKDDSGLENQCWSVQAGITQVPMTIAPAGARRLRDAAEAVYTVKEITPQSGVEHTFAYDPVTATATVSLKNYYLRWLQVSVDQYGPAGEKVGETQALGDLSSVNTIMAAPLPPDASDFPFTFDEKASRAVVTFGGLGQAPMNWTYDGDGIGLTTLFNYAIPMMFIALGVAVSEDGEGIRRFFCSCAGCKRKTFAEPIPGLTARSRPAAPRTGPRSPSQSAACGRSPAPGLASPGDNSPRRQSRRFSSGYVTDRRSPLSPGLSAPRLLHHQRSSGVYPVKTPWVSSSGCATASDPIRSARLDG